MTPPPCFTASESTADTVGMHPLENLLIEHPSMSVYWPRDRLDLEADLDPEDEQPGEGQVVEAQVIDYMVHGGRFADDALPPHGYQLLVDFNQIFSYHSPFNFLRDQYIRIGDDPLTDAPPTDISPSSIPPTSGSSAQRPEAGSVVSNVQLQGTAYSFLTPHQIRLTANRLGSYLGLFVRGGPAPEDQKAQRQLSRQENARKVLDHQNRVRDFASSAKIRTRKDRMGCPSGRSNNRKC